MRLPKVPRYKEDDKTNPKGLGEEDDAVDWRLQVIDAMDALFTCLKTEDQAIVRAILGHYIFVYIHPYMDGNGRLGRFLMNAMLLSGGYPWTIIHVQDRMLYLNALETAGCKQNIEPFAKFIKKSLIRS